MPHADDANPARREVRRQLHRMLTHPLFAARPQQARVFDYLVSSALEDKEVTEKSILAKFFPSPPYEVESTVARTTVSFIRTKLVREYYAGEGKDDPIIITLPDPKENKTASGKAIKLPPGRAYKTTFTYNPRHEMSKEYALGNYKLNRGSVSQAMEAVMHFSNVVKMEPGHPGALLGIAEALCAWALFNKSGDSKEFFRIADDIITKTTRLAPDFWRTHAARAILHISRGEFDAAGKEFEVALKLDRTRVSECSWYSYFLSKTGQVSEASRIRADYANEHIDDAVAHSMHGIYLCKAERYDEAERVFERALSIDRNCWLAHLGMVCLYISTKQPEKVVQQSKRLESLLSPLDYELLAHRLNLKPWTE